MLAVCGGYQLLGESYETADGDVVKGMGVVDMRTVNGSGRLIGNVAIDASMHETHTPVIKSSASRTTEDARCSANP